MNLAHYLLQVNIYLIVFYGFYRLLLDRETYFMLNRLYLTSAAFFSLLIPFIRLDWFTALPVTQNVSIGVSQMYMVGLNDNASSGLTWGSSIALLYITGVCLFLARFVMQLLAIRKLLQSVPTGAAFSFFNKLVIHEQLPQQDVISKHEQIHMRQMHSLDVIFLELLGVFTWFNPVIYLYKQSIKNIHEYLADEEAAQYQGDKQQYSLLLLSSAFGVDPNTLTNSFFNKSMIKKRITMLHKEKSRRTAILKYGLFLPLFGLTLILSSATISKNESIRVAAESIPLDQPLKVVEEALPTTITKPEQQAAFVMPQKGTQMNQDKVYDFTSVDTAPKFPGGMEKFYMYVGKTIKYPQQAVKNNVQGKVFLSFIVEKDGRLTEIHVDKPLGAGTDEEAVRVLKSSPRWSPGLKDHKPIRVKYNMPISFALGGGPVSEPQKSVNVVRINPESNQDTLRKTTNGVKIRANAKAQPIYIIDGVKATSETIQKLDTKNIESVNVFKGAAAEKMIAGSTNNGVIVIKTKVATVSTSNK
jgi:TonB family protein